MSIGVFSLSLAVKDIAKSREFYEHLGFREFDGNQDQGWLIMTDGGVTIGLFQGMFENNLMTFNPGWGRGAKPLEDFEDIRDIAKRLKEAGVPFDKEIEQGDSGPAHFAITDPDGNMILVDQHV